MVLMREDWFGLLDRFWYQLDEHFSFAQHTSMFMLQGRCLNSHFGWDYHVLTGRKKPAMAHVKDKARNG